MKAPMRSLNVAIAAAMVAGEATRQMRLGATA
jgi:tRNA(Leu) C34 or U34 (ribose-2'-O)-methylase TrmL